MFTSILLQAAQVPVTTATTQKAENAFDIFMKAGWILIPLVLMSLIAVYLIVYKWVELSGASCSKNLTDEISPMLKSGKIDEAIAACQAVNKPVGNMLSVGLQNVGSPIKDIQDNMESEARQQVDELSSSMHHLSIISSVAPMFGFLGTIFGVIKIFYNIALTDNISIGVISGGLYQKMISSATGLLIGIIAFTGYHLLNAKIDRITSDMERQGNRLINLLRNNK
jgi:biopolymer transport protein ExbB